MGKSSTQSGSLSSKKRKHLELRLKQKGISTLGTQEILRRKEMGSCPLSFAQQRLWFLDQLEPESTAYLIPRVFRLGEVDAHSMERALQELINRHESLRTTFEERVGQPIQVIHPISPFTLPIIDLQGLSHELREQEGQRLARQEAQRPCDLTKGPLLRTYALRLDLQEHVLLLTLHHIITDGWSNQVLEHELTRVYQAFVARQPSPLTPLPIQYADYALWQRQWLQGEVLEAQLAYWRAHLADVPPLELPTDHPRPAVQRSQGALESLHLPLVLLEQLAALSQQENVTLFMLLLAAFQVLLQRYSGQSDISVGTPIANRRQAETEGLIGFFVNTLVLRGDLSVDPSFVQLLQRVREVCLGAYGHQDVPFEQVVEALAPTRDLSRSPLFQVLLVLQNTNHPQEQEDLAGVQVRSLAVERTISKFDLTLALGETEQGLHCVLEYNTDLFKAETISRLLGHWHILLDGIVANPQARLWQLPLLTAEEQEQLLVHWNATTRPYPQELCVHQLFEQQVERTPDAVALVFEEEQLSYDALNRRANLLAHYLQKSGVGSEGVVGICLPRSLELFVGLLGVLKAGGAYLPLDPTSPTERLAYMLEDTHALVLVTTMSSLANSGLDLLNITTVCLDRDWSLFASSRTEKLLCNVHPENLAYVIYTSGSTGQPKGVLVSQQGFLNYLWWAIRHYRVAQGTGAPLHSSISFDLTVTSIFSPLLVGQMIVIMPEEQGIEPLGVTLGDQRNFSLVKLTPAHLEGLTHYLPTEELVNAPQAMIIGGEALSYEQLTFWRTYAPDTRLINEYGPTETVVGCCVYEVLKGDPTEGRVPIGRPISNMQMYVLNTKMQPTAIGVVGELYIGGIGVARGYVNRPEETAASFIAHPFSKRGGERLYRTGDLARYLPNGELEYVGRIDQQVKIRGYRIEPAEIEAALKKHSAIQTAVILAREDVPGEKRLVAYVVTHHGESLSGSELRIFLQNYLPVYMLPSVFVLLNVLPLTPNGKIDRQALPNPEETLNAERGASKEARTPLEELLVGIWSDVLGRKQIGIRDNFFELGGHSLLATQLMARVQATMEVEVPLRSVFEVPTVAGLAQRIEQALRKNEGRAMPPLVVMERPEELPLSFAQQRLWFLNQLDPGSTAYLVPRAYRLGGEIDAHSLERGIEELIHRHESLRTTFPKRAGWAVQVIHPAAPHIVPVIDLQTLDHDIREQEARRLTNQEAQHPCDLTTGPLLRTSLLRLEPQEHVLLLTLHHIITDGWSNAIVVHELTTLYQAYVTGQPSPLAPLPIQYADYALWQRRWLQGDILETQLTYWTRRLGGAPAIQLPTDYPHPSVASFRAGAHPFALSAELSQALVVLSCQESVTLFMLLLAAFQVLFYRYTEQLDIVIGTDSAGRHLVEVEGLIGFFVNVLALRTDLSGMPTFREMLKRVREVTLGAYTHQDTPFDLLVEKLVFDRNLDRMPLVQVLFVLQNTHLEPGRSREREAEVAQKAVQQSFPHSVEDEETMVKFDVALFMWERDGRLFGTLNYRLDLFKASTIALMTDRFEALLQSIVKEPDMLIHLLEWTSDGERTQQEQNEREQRPELRLHDDGWLDLSDRSFTRSTDS